MLPASMDLFASFEFPFRCFPACSASRANLVED